MERDAQLYDGKSSAPAEVKLVLDGDGLLHIVGVGGDSRTLPVSSLQVHDRVGQGVPRSIELPTGELLHVPPDPAWDGLLDRLAGGGRGWVRRLESQWTVAVAALLLVLAGAAGFVRYGVPALAAAAAARVPADLDARIGRLALAQFDQGVLGGSKLTVERQAALREMFDRQIAAGLPGAASWQLEFRAGGSVGANAIALPGGIVIVTDELVALSEHDEELLMVLAHEAGHVVARHSLEQLFESLGTTLLVMTLTGDPGSPASLAAAAPAVLIQAGYSREDEREADRFAYDWADSQGIPRTRLTDLLARVEEAEGTDGIPSLLSTHPATEERARAAEGSTE